MNKILRMMARWLGTLGRLLGLAQAPFLEKLYIRITHYLLPNSDVLVSVNHHKMVVPNPRQSVLGRMLYLHGIWEPEVTRFLYAQVSPGWTAIDVGAHVGYYTLLLAKLVGEGGKVVAFEPNPSVRCLLEENVRINNYCQVTLYPFALFSRTGTTLLENLDGSNSRLSKETTRRGQETVKMIEFDHCQTEVGIDQVDFIKMDVEGAEVDVLYGMRRLLGQCHPSLLIEVHLEGLAHFGHTPSDLMGFLEPLGYVVKLLWSEPATMTIFCHWDLLRPSPESPHVVV